MAAHRSRKQRRSKQRRSKQRRSKQRRTRRGGDGDDDFHVFFENGEIFPLMIPVGVFS